MEDRTKLQAANILITGASGFLGTALLKELLDDPDHPFTGNLRVLDISPVAPAYRSRLEFFQGDVRDPEIVRAACSGMDIVLHLAAIIDWGVKSAEEILAVNVGGTEHVLRACRDEGVEYMVHTSSLDAVYSGRALRDIDESQPYPVKHATVYCESKRRSEEIVLAAAGESVKTVVLRPADIYGESDPYHIDSLVDMARGGFYVRLGNGKSRCQHVYAGNIASALLQAGAALLNGNNSVAGQAYFITDSGPSNFFKFFDQVVAGAGYPIRPKNLWVPYPVAYGMACISEFIAWLARPVKKYHPKFSRFAVDYTCTDFTFTAGKAEKDFEFTPKYALEEALDRTIEHYRIQRETC